VGGGGVCQLAAGWTLLSEVEAEAPPVMGWAGEVRGWPGHGETLTLFNLVPAKAGLYASQLTDINSGINRTIYDGFEASFNARLSRGANVFGGWSNDRLITVSCDQYDPNKLRYCDQTGETFQQYGKTSKPPFRNDFKLSANYPLGWGVEVSGYIRTWVKRGWRSQRSRSW